MSKDKLIVGETVFYNNEWYTITQCIWKNGGRVYTLKSACITNLSIIDVEEEELLK